MLSSKPWGVHATASKKLRGPMMESSTKPGRMPAVSTRTTAALLVVVAVAHLALGRAHNHLSLASDDNLWLYVTGASLNRSAQVAGLQDRVLNSMRENNVAASTLVRIELRKAYDRNYIAASVVYRLTTEAISSFFPSLTTHYSTFLAHSLFSGFVIMYVITGALVLLVGWFCGNDRLALAVPVSIALTGVI